MENPTTTLEFLRYVWNLDIKPSEKLVLLASLDCTDEHGKLAIDRSVLCKRTGYSLRAVDRNLNTLMKKKVIAIEKRVRAKNGRFTPFIYRINLSASVKSSTAGYIYLFRAGELYKIGKSINPKSRLLGIKNQAKAHTGSEPILIHSIKSNDYHKGEEKLKKHFAAKEVSREWFRLNTDDVEYIKSLTSI